MTVIPIFKPSFGEEELSHVREALTSGWVGLGPKVKQFEQRFAEYIGVAHVVGLDSGTSALDLAMRLSSIETYEVITTPLTFISTNHAILYHGGVPVFCDIEPDTLNIDASKIEALVTPRTRAIVVVHYGGHACDMDPILEIAHRHHLVVIEDCAHATGGSYKARKLGSIGDHGCFSFHAVKNLAMGEGGALTARSDEEAARIKRLRWMGISRSTWERSDNPAHQYTWFYDVTELGYKCHLNDIAAGIGLAQLDKLGSTNARRRAITGTYNEAFKALDWLKTPVVKPYAQSSHHMYVVSTPYRDALHMHLASLGVSTSVHYIPSTHYEMYAAYRRPLPVCEQAWAEILTLPLYPGLTDSDISRVIEGVRSFAPAPVPR